MNTQFDKKNSEEKGEGTIMSKLTNRKGIVFGVIAATALVIGMFFMFGKKDKPFDYSAVAQDKEYTVQLKKLGEQSYAEIIGDKLTAQDVANIAGAIEDNEKDSYIVYNFGKEPKDFSPNGEYVKGLKFKADFTEKGRLLSEYNVFPGTKADIDTYKEWKVLEAKISDKNEKTTVLTTKFSGKGEAGKSLSQGKGFSESLRQLNPKTDYGTMKVKMTDGENNFVYNEANKDVIETIVEYVK